MTFFKFEDDDIFTTSIVAHPSYKVSLYGNALTGAIHLEREYLTTALSQRVREGIDQREKLKTRVGPFTASVNMMKADSGGTLTADLMNYSAVTNLYDYYNFENSQYTASFNDAAVTQYRIINIPQVYYDKEILTGSFTASDVDSAGDSRYLYDNGRGGIYSGSLTGTLVGNIFYSEGVVVLKGGGLNDFDSNNEYGAASGSNFYWEVNFKGTHKIPVNIFKCRAKAGELNCSSNPTYYTVPTGSDDDYVNQRKIVLDEPYTYISAIGIYNDDYELVAVAKLAQSVRKNSKESVLFRIRADR